MHIPDGYLSPATCAVGYVAVAPVWVAASRKIRNVVKTRNIPTLAVFAALSFVIMMFNIPIPDGTTAHAVGGVVVAIVLGPWAAVISVSVALLFQALLFGDGGVLSFGVNCLNMAVLLPFVGYAVYRLIAGRAPLTSKRRVIAAGIGGYAGINAAALATAIELGLQPELFTASDGTPLYAPYGMSKTIPAMMVAHLTFAGLAELVLAGAIVAYLQRADVTRLVANHPGIPVTRNGAEPARTRRRIGPGQVALGVGLALVVLTPIGLLAPGGAFGEDAPGDLDLKDLGLKAVPSGLDKYNGVWSHTLLGDYGFKSGDHANLAYILSAVVGIVVVTTAVFIVGKLVQWAWGARPGNDTTSHDTPDVEHSGQASS